MAALLARDSMIARLICWHAGSAGQILSDRKKLGSLIIIKRRKNSPPNIGCKTGAWLNRQLVQREMRGAKTDCSLKLLFPLLGRVAGKGIDQVQADPFELRLGRLKRAQCLLCPVKAAQPAQGLDRKSVV